MMKIEKNKKLAKLALDNNYYMNLMACPDADKKFSLRAGDLLIFYYFPSKDVPKSCILSFGNKEVCVKLFGIVNYCFTPTCNYHDARLRHASCPVFKGTKYSLTYWIH